MEQTSKSLDKLKLNIKRTILVGLAFFTITMFWEVYDSVMPLFLNDFGFSSTLRGVVMALDNSLALVLLPFMGLLSDRFPMKLRSKFGRRIPFIVCGSILAATCFLFLNLAHNQRNLVFMMLSTVFVLLFMCLYRTPAVSLMPDITPKVIRSQGNTVINMMGTIGGVITLVAMTVLLKTEPIAGKFEDGEQVYRLVGNNWILVCIISALMVLSSLVMIFKVKENKFVEDKLSQMQKLGIVEDEDGAGEKSEKISIKSVFASLSRAQIKSLIFLLLSVSLWYMAYNGAKSHFSVFSLEIIGDKNFTLPLILANAAAFAMFIPASIIGKKIGRKFTVMLGVVLLIVGFALGALILLFGSVSIIKFAMYPVFLFVGAGWASINVHSYVMSVEMATEKTTGAFTGLYYTFAMVAQILAPIVAGLVMDYINPKLLLVYSLTFSALAFLTMIFVKHGNAKDGSPDAQQGLSTKTDKE